MLHQRQLQSQADLGLKQGWKAVIFLGGEGNLAGILRDFFGPTKQRLKNLGEKFGAFFVRNFVAQKNIFCAKIRSASVPS